MTKQALQAELKEKIKPGVKASDLKKLKRSKSDSDINNIPSPPPLSVPLSKSKSQEPPFRDEKYPYTTLISQQQELEELKNSLSSFDKERQKLKKETTAKSDTIKLLRGKIEEMEKSNPPNALLTDQLKEKQKEVEDLRKQLETKNQELNSLKSQHSTLLDDNLTLKHQSLKDWWQQYEKTQSLEKEFKENVDYASEELLNQDKVINQLRSENSKLKKTNQSLAKDLDLTQKLAELRRNPLPSPINNPWIPSALTFLLIGTLLWLTVK